MGRWFLLHQTTGTTASLLCGILVGDLRDLAGDVISVNLGQTVFLVDAGFLGGGFGFILCFGFALNGFVDDNDPATGRRLTLTLSIGRATQDSRETGELVASFGPAIGGRGGGKPDMAQGAGSDPAGIPAALDAFRARLSELAG